MAAVPPWPILQQGSAGTNVRALQCLLNYRNNNTALTDDGGFGPITRNAVITYQSSNGLSPDGMAGQNTLSSLIATVQNGTINSAGYIQLTGRNNYTAFSSAMNDPQIVNIGVDHVADNYPWSSAGYFWNNIANLNPLCDSGASVEAITRVVNGGINGLSERQRYYNICLTVF